MLAQSHVLKLYTIPFHYSRKCRPQIVQFIGSQFSGHFLREKMRYRVVENIVYDCEKQHSTASSLQLALNYSPLIHFGIKDGDKSLNARECVY